MIEGGSEEREERELEVMVTDAIDSSGSKSCDNLSTDLDVLITDTV